MKLGSVLAESTITHTCSKCGKTMIRRKKMKCSDVQNVVPLWTKEEDNHGQTD